MSLPCGLVECGACGKPCRRKGVEQSVYLGQSVPIMVSRTLVYGRFLPSCSVPCCKSLRYLAQNAKGVRR